MNNLIKDPHFKVKVLAKTPRPNLVSYLAMHQCYSELGAGDEVEKFEKLPDSELGDRIVKHCLNHGHWSVVEHPSITFSVIGFPHSVMVQATRHRTLSFSVQSGRYTGDRILKLAEKIVKTNCDDVYDENIISTLGEEIKKIFYFRPLGTYTDRHGTKYEYSQREFKNDLYYVLINLKHYYYISKTARYAHEHSRDMLTQNMRQDFVVTFNPRSLCHFLDLRTPADAQPEIRTLAYMLFDEFKAWMPEVASWYEQKRINRNKLAP